MEVKFPLGLKSLHLLCVYGSECNEEVTQVFDLFHSTKPLNCDAIILIDNPKEMETGESLKHFFELHINKPVIHLKEKSAINVKVDKELALIELDISKGKEGFEDFVVALNNYEKTTSFLWITKELSLNEMEEKYFSGIIKKYSDNVLGVVYGSEDEMKMIKGIESIGTGRFKEGKFCTITLVKSESDNWRLGSYKFFNLSYML